MIQKLTSFSDSHSHDFTRYDTELFNQTLQLFLTPTNNTLPIMNTNEEAMDIS